MNVTVLVLLIVGGGLLLAMVIVGLAGTMLRTSESSSRSLVRSSLLDQIDGRQTPQ